MSAGSIQPPEGYLGADARITSGPAAELVEAGYQLEVADAPLLHHGLGLADLAHVLELRDQDVISSADTATLLHVLLELLDVPAEQFPYDPIYGDAYNSRERELERRISALAGWLHTGRTRREAGRIAFRLALRDRLLALHEAVDRFVGAVVDQAMRHADAVWADTTYLQPAQPSTFGHYLSSFGEQATRDLARVEAAHAWADQSPGGIGGVGGSRTPLDRDRIAARLGFAAAGAHSRDVMWSVDGLADAVVAAAQAATTVDRLAADLEIFASPGFSYVTLDASLCRASVLMPQKRNPYALAVIRAGAGTLIGRATGMLATQRSPSAQTDNWLHAYGEVSGALDLARRVVALAAQVIATLEVDREALAAGAGTGFTGSADLAEELVLRHGIDYRSAYRVVGKAVADALARGDTTLRAEDVTAAAAALGHSVSATSDEVAVALDPAQIVSGRTTPGGSGPAQVQAHAAALSQQRAAASAWREQRRDHNCRAERDLLAAARAAQAAVDRPCTSSE